MLINKLKISFLALTTFFCVLLLFTFSVSAQRRDHLTEMETELVREFQEIDKRTEILVKAINRRFLVLNAVNIGNDKQIKKDSEKWGELPTGSRRELLLDIEKILQESVDNIDNVAERNIESELFPKSVNILADASRKFLPQLKLQLDKTNSDMEKGAILGSIEFCNQIIEASTKIPKVLKEEKKKKN
jgi:hypothetical protein